MTKYIEKLGVPKKWGVVDVLGLDPDLLEFVPKPVKALILLFPCSEAVSFFSCRLSTIWLDYCFLISCFVQHLLYTLLLSFEISIHLKLEKKANKSETLRKLRTSLYKL